MVPVVYNFDHYRVFYYVAEKGNMAKAADALGMVPSSITKIIQALEAELQCTLFVRTPKGVILTEEGRTLMKRVRPAFTLLQSGMQEIQEIRSLGIGSVTIGLASDVIPNALCGSWFEEFRNKYPNIQIETINLTRDRVTLELEEGKIDFALVGSQITRTGNPGPLIHLNFDILFEVHDIAICGGDLSDLANNPITIEELSAYPLVFSSNRYSPAYEEYTARYLEHGLYFEPSIRTSVVGMQINCVRNGLGYSFVPETSAEGPLRDHQCRRLNVINMEPHSRALGIATSPNIPVGHAAAAFIDIIHTWCRQNI